MMIFEWDLKKEQTNLKKHGLSFKEAKTVFYDEDAILIPDPDHSNEEERFLILGMSLNARILTVCHCYREGEEKVRIINARKATTKEKKTYITRRGE